MNLRNCGRFLAILACEAISALSQPVSAQTGGYPPFPPRAQAILQACQAEFDAWWVAMDKRQSIGPRNIGNATRESLKENFRGHEHSPCGASPFPSGHWERELEVTRKRRAEESSRSYTGAMAEMQARSIAGTYESEAHIYLQSCVWRWLASPQCVPPGSSQAGGAAGNREAAKPAVQQVQVKQVEAKGSNGCIKVRALETRPWGETNREKSLETTIELRNTCKTEQKFDTRYPPFPHPGMARWESNKTARSWFPQNNAFGYYGPAYQLWQAYMPLPKDLGFLYPLIATLDTSAAIVPGGILHATFLQTIGDVVDPVIVKTGSCDFARGGRQQIVLADIELENFACRFPPDPKALERISKQARDGILVAQERQVQASQDRGGKGKKHVRAAEAHDCIQLSGKSGRGSFINSCAYAVELHYCAAQPASGTSGHEVDCDRTNGAGARLGAGSSYNAPVKGAGNVYWFACKDGAIPVDVDYVRGKGLQGRCHGRG